MHHEHRAKHSPLLLPVCDAAPVTDICINDPGPQVTM